MSTWFPPVVGYHGSIGPTVSLPHTQPCITRVMALTNLRSLTAWPGGPVGSPPPKLGPAQDTGSMKEREMGAVKARLWARRIHGLVGETRHLAPRSQIWGSLGSCEGCLEAASRSFGVYPFQPPDFPEETLTSSHSQLETCCLRATWQTT